jgi:phosphoserine aminotransferase
MRVYNFSPGPAMLPLEVLEQVRGELTDWHGSGMSVTEVSHRSREFLAAAERCEADLRELLAIPSSYRVLFLQGGAQGQFAAVPLNLAPAGATVDYLDTGSWSRRAIDEAGHYARVVTVADGGGEKCRAIPPPATWRRSPAAAYLHYVANETISGVEFHFYPDSGAVPLVADCSSTLLSRPIAIERFGLIYAGAQKNLGIAGLTIVIVREDLLGRARPETPGVLNYTLQAAAGSMFNTPATFSWYVAGLVLQWVKRAGGIAAMAERNRAKAEMLYGYIDGSEFYRNEIAADCRSWMNVTFRLPNAELETRFAQEASAAGLTNLAGHRSVGGLRASIYNAMPLEGVASLVAFMRAFAARARGSGA